MRASRTGSPRSRDARRQDADADARGASAAPRADDGAGGRLALSLGTDARRARAARRPARKRARASFRGHSRRRRDRDRGDARPSRGDASPSPHEGGGGAADRVRGYRERMAADAGDRAADPVGRRGGERRGRPPARRCAAPRHARRRVPAPGAGLGLYRARDGQDGCGRAQLFERYRPDRVLRRRRARTRTGACAVLRAAHAGPGEAVAGAHVRRLRVSYRSAAASGSRLDPDRDFHGGGARLLREPRTELGARRADQGASLRRGYRGRRGVARRALALHLAQISRLRRGGRHPCHEAADPCLSRT